MGEVHIATIVRGLRRGLVGAPLRAGDRFGELVGDAPVGRLDRLMRSPARRAVLAVVFWQMPSYFNRSRAAGVRSIVRWRVTGAATGRADVYELHIADGSARVHRRESEAQPRVTISVDGGEFLRLITGNSDPIQAYFTGKLQIAGDLLHAAKLTALFRMPGDAAASGAGSQRR